MRVRLAVIGTATVLAVALLFAPAGAVRTKIPGSVRCTMENGFVTFGQPLLSREWIGGKSTGRGPSDSTFTATLIGCTDPSSAPAPGGIDHGVVQATGRVGGSHCEKLGKLKFKTTVQWLTATEAVVGETGARLGIAVAPPDGFYEPVPAELSGSAKNGSTVLPGDAVSASLTTTKPAWAFQVGCFKTGLATFGFEPTTIAFDAP